MSVFARDGAWRPAAGRRRPSASSAPGFGFGVECLGFIIWGMGVVVQGSGFSVECLVFSVWGLGFRVQGSGFSVKG